MKNYFGKALPLLIIVILMLLAAPGEAGAFDYGNDGSEENPYRIETAEQLATVAEAVYLDKHFILVSDIDLADYLSEGGAGHNDGAGWVPIGTVATSFNGSFDGNGHTISNLFIDRPGRECGLFGYTWSGSSIKNLGLVDVNVTGRDVVGGLVGLNAHGSIENSYVTGVLKGYGDSVGGLVGRNVLGTITGSYTTSTVTGNVENVGGLVGRNIDGTITNSHATGAVTGAIGVGGLTGEHNGGTITNSYATGAVTGVYNVGGLVGSNPSASGTITGSYATGVVEGINRVGGLVGYNIYGTIIDSHAKGDATGGSDIGGLVGYNQWGTIKNTYSTGVVTGADNVGGLVGNNGVGVIINSYATGSVIGYGDNVGGLVGKNGGAITDSYAVGFVKGYGVGVGGLVGDMDTGSLISSSFYDSDTTGQSDARIGAKDTAEMKAYATFRGAGWDLIDETVNGAEDVWGIDESLNNPANDGYPFLAWQGYDHKIRPAVTTGEVDDITATTAVVQGEITYLGYPGNPAQHGVVWSEEVNPTLDDSITEEGAASATGTFTSTITGLEPDTVYYVRAYVTNAAGTFYGEQVQFTTESPATVNIAAIPGVTPPATGGTPVTAITGTDQYTGTVSWSPGHNPFQGATVYTATITLTAKAGFTFEGVAAGFFTMAGATSTANDADSGVVTAVFPATEAAPDPQYITITDTSPADGAAGVSWTPAITVTFSDNIQADSSYGAITLKDAGSNTVSSSKNISGQVLTITPEGNLTYGTTYTVTVPADAVKSADAEANLAGQYQFSFTTRPAPTGGGGGGGSVAPKPATETSKKINAAAGGTVSLGDVSVHISTGALPGDATFSIRKLTENEVDDIVPKGLRLKLAGDIYDITTTGSRDFGDNTITIKIPYDPDKIAAGEAPVINHCDEETGAWTVLETTAEQDVDGKWYAVVKVNHLTKFAVFSTVVGEPVLPQKVIKLTIGSTQATVDGQPYILDAAPFVDARADRTLVPIRFVSEALGAEVEWLAETRQVTITDVGKEIILTVGSIDVLVNGQKTAIDSAPATLPPGRNFVPLRFVGETLGARVDYDSVIEQISIER